MSLKFSKKTLLILHSRRGFKICAPLNEVGFPFDAFRVKRNFFLNQLCFFLPLCSKKLCYQAVLTDSPGWIGMISYYIASSWKVPLIWRARGDALTQYMDNNNWVQRFFFTKILMPRLDGIICVSVDLKRLLQKQFPYIEEKKIHVVPTPQECFSGDINDFQHRNDEILIVLNFHFASKARLLFHKIPEIQKLLSKYSGLRITVIGDGPHRKNVENAFSKDFSDKIQFLGFVKNVQQYYCRAKYMLYVSEMDGYPSVVNEARAAGLPVISNFAVGMKDQISDSKDGLFFDYNDRSLEDAFELLSSINFWNFISKNGMERVKKENSNEAIGRELRSAIEKLIP
jgi:glycosyltransferase involved in cell wall biosynthesis